MTCLAGLVHGLVGYGIGLVALPFFALVAPESVPQLVILIGTPPVLYTTWQRRRPLQQQGVAWLLWGRALGTVPGVLLLVYLAPSALKVLYGVAILVTVAVMAARRVQLRVSDTSKFLVGGLSGVMGTTAGLGGAPVALLHADSRGEDMRSMVAVALLFGNLLSLGSLAVAQLVRAQDLVFFLGLLPFLYVGIYAGTRGARRLDGSRVRHTVLLAAFVAGLALIVQAAAGI